MILVTGGTGLVGSHLLYHLLQKNDSVKATHQKTSDLDAVKKVFRYYTSDFEIYFNKIIWIEADICDISSLGHAFNSITYVYHCAALVSFNPNDYHKMRRININGTTNIVNFCISNNIKKLCFVSSVASISNDDNTNIDETKIWTNSTNKSEYAITKYGAEMEVWRASQEGIDVVIVNPGIILGSGFWNKGSGKLFSKIYNGLKYYSCGVTGFVGVIDVVQIMLKLMQSDIKNQRYILVSENASYKDILYKIADSFHKKRPSIKINYVVSEIIWRLDFIGHKIFRKAPLLTKNSARSSQLKKYYSSEKIKNAISYKFECIDKTIQVVCNNYLKGL